MQLTTIGALGRFSRFNAGCVFGKLLGYCFSNAVGMLRYRSPPRQLHHWNATKRNTAKPKFHFCILGVRVRSHLNICIGAGRLVHEIPHMSMLNCIFVDRREYAHFRRKFVGFIFVHLNVLCFALD